MSQAVIEFCDALQATLLGIEDLLDKAKRDLDSGAAQAQEQARKHVETATSQLAAFKTQAGEMARSLRAEIPVKAKPVQEKLQDFGQDAQMAMRHAVIFLAETAAKGAGGASSVLRDGAHRAEALAENMRRETAVTVTQTPPEPSPKSPTP